jgi:hypothetical protein
MNCIRQLRCECTKLDHLKKATKHPHNTGGFVIDLERIHWHIPIFSSRQKLRFYSACTWGLTNAFAIARPLKAGARLSTKARLVARSFVFLNQAGRRSLSSGSAEPPFLLDRHRAAVVQMDQKIMLFSKAALTAVCQGRTYARKRAQCDRGAYQFAPATRRYGANRFR